MANPSHAQFLGRSLRLLASRVGYDAVWLAIAGLFCVVEGAVFVTERLPLRFARRHAGLRPYATSTPSHGAFAS